MKKFILLFFFTALTISLSAQITCKIEGKIKNRPQSKVLYFAPNHTEWRSAEFIKIPILDSSFSYVLTTNAPQLYELVFEDELNNGSWQAIEVMIEEGKIAFELNPIDHSEKNIIKGGTLNDRFQYLKKEPSKIHSKKKLYNIMDSLYENNLYRSEVYRLWSIEFDKIKENFQKRDSMFKIRNNIELYSEIAKFYIKKIDSVNREKFNWVLLEIDNNVDESGLATLNEFIYRAINYGSESYIDLKRCKELYYEKYKVKFNKNPMAEEIERLLASTEVKVNNKFPDFKAPDLDGKEHKLSELVDKKIAVIDLWASWCGPCMRTSKSLIPVWEKYKEKGFTIIGIAREKESTKAMVNAIQRLKLPWLNLVELNDERKIWTMYGISNSGGKVILVDKKGVIVAIDFDAKELEEYLEKAFQ